MPTKGERDELTGTETTGHVWDGIKELNTPLPKWWVYVFWATIVWALAYYVLYPAIPGISGYTRGLLGYSQRVELERDLAAAAARQAPLRNKIAQRTFAEIRADPELFAFALAGGRVAFADNCAPCHGAGGGGGRGFPNLDDDDWLWGGEIEQVYRTVRFGVRSGHEEAHQTEMPRFGVDGLLEPAEINDVAEYVLSLSGKATDAAAAARGRAVFEEQCASCHGESGEGNTDLGAPRLSDGIWLYGGTKADIVAQVTDPRMGVMPAWTGRLDDVTIKMLALYVRSLGGGR